MTSPQYMTSRSFRGSLTGLCSSYRIKMGSPCRIKRLYCVSHNVAIERKAQTILQVREIRKRRTLAYLSAARRLVHLESSPHCTYIYTRRVSSRTPPTTVGTSLQNRSYRHFGVMSIHPVASLHPVGLRSGEVYVWRYRH